MNWKISEKRGNYGVTEPFFIPSFFESGSHKDEKPIPKNPSLLSHTGKGGNFIHK
jgi:hypothetical protein